MIRLGRKLQLRWDGLLLLSLMTFFSDLSLLFAIIGNVVVHELGHIVMLRKYGVFIRCVTLGASGLCIQCSLFGLTSRAQFLCAFAGPLFGLAAAIVASFWGNALELEFLLIFAGVGFVLSMFNLIPVQPLDGWRMLHALAPEASYIVGTLCGIAVLCFGVYLMVNGYGTALACMGIFFLLQKRRNSVAFA